MSSGTPREVGTLVVVVLKAKNLPNKRHIGKQDPYCSVTFNGEKKRTKAIKRGGQHPEWDEEFRYTLYEDTDSLVATPPTENGTPPPPPPKKSKGPPSVKGGRAMAVACYADDAREPDFIGETNVDLTEVLTRGETDEWFTLMNREKYCGEVYLELTFWSNEPEPAKKVTPKPNGKSQRHYGGPGQFVPAGESPPHNEIDVQEAIRSFPTGGSRSELRPDHIPPSLRPSTSHNRLDLYVPPYETSRSRHSMVDSVAGEFAELSVEPHADRGWSLPPQQTGYARRPALSVGSQDQRAVSPQPNLGFHHGTYSDSGQPYYEGGPYQQGLPPEHYQPPYESLQPALTGYQVPVRHGPRHSMPTASSGFVPVPTPTPSGFVPLSSHQSQPSGFVPLSSHQLQPSGFAPLQSTTPALQNYGPPATHTGVPSSSFSTLPQLPVASSGFTGQPPNSMSYHRSSLPQPPQPQSPVNYSYAPPPSTAPQQLPPPPPPLSAPPITPPGHTPYAPPPPPPSVSPQSHSTPPMQYTGHTVPPSTSHDHVPPPPPLHESQPLGQSTSSRPLPQPSAMPPRRRQSSLPVPPAGGPPGMYNPQRGPSGSFSSTLVGEPGTYTTAQTGPPVPYNASALRAPSGSYTGQGQIGLYTQPTSSSLSYNQPPTQSIRYSTSGGVSPGDAPASLYNSIPPPPPLPLQTTPAPQSSQPPMTASTSSLPPPGLARSPSLPAPPQNTLRRPSLPPAPSVTYTGQHQPQSAFQALPPPPAPPSMPPNSYYEPASSYLPPSNSKTFHPGPPPRPPAQPQEQAQYPQYSGNQQSMYGGHSPITGGGW